MTLGHIERGARLSIFEEIDKHDVGDEIEATFNYLEDEGLFIVHSDKLSERYDSLGPGSHLHISLRVGAFIHTFTGHVKEKKRGGMVLVEQLTEIVTYNRRQYDRDEIRVSIRIFSLPHEELSGKTFGVNTERQVISDMIFDISAGGLCIISNTNINAKHDPYYLVEFAFNDIDYFRLPAELVRRSDHQRTRIGKYDYGFRFVYDTIPEEKDRLFKAIVNRKLASI